LKILALRTASYLLSTAGDPTCTRRVPAGTLLGAGDPTCTRRVPARTLLGAGDLTCTRRVPARTLLGAGRDSPNNRVGPSTARGQGVATRLESIMLNYYFIVEFFHVIIITIASLAIVLKLC